MSEEKLILKQKIQSLEVIIMSQNNLIETAGGNLLKRDAARYPIDRDTKL